MKICILGAGVVGLTTAWNLADAGHEVELVDANDGPGLETSFGNGAQLSYAFVAPYASPSFLRKLPLAILGKDPAILVKLRLNLDFLRWGLKFLSACTGGRSRWATERLLSLAALSRSEVSELTASLGLDFGLRAAGKLLIYRDRAEFDAARSDGLFARAGIERDVLTPSECLSFEPALNLSSNEFAGGIYTATEEVGDCAKFCSELYARLRRRQNVITRFGVRVEYPGVSAGALKSVTTTAGELRADVFVLSMASSSASFARKCGFYLPIYPIKGYSLTLRSKQESPPLTHSVTDISRKIVFAPLTQEKPSVIRVAGIADLVGSDRAIDQSRLKVLRDSASEIISAEPDDVAKPWAGLRPATPDGMPITGWSPIKNLFLNTGHGGFGWTLACGSARITADSIGRAEDQRVA